MPRNPAPGQCHHTDAFVEHVMDCTECFAVVEANGPTPNLCTRGLLLLVAGRGCVGCMNETKKELAKCRN